MEFRYNSVVLLPMLEMVSYNPLDKDRIVNNRELSLNAYLQIESIKNYILDDFSR